MLVLMIPITVRRFGSLDIQPRLRSIDILPLSTRSGTRRYMRLGIAISSIRHGLSSQTQTAWPCGREILSLC